MKRFADICISALSLFVLSPLLLSIAAIIYVNDKGNPFFLQKRVGLFGREFYLVKFRTMYLGADRDQRNLLKQNQAPYPMFKMHDDPRFVGIGKLLSRTGLDELPQLWNILKGEMSFVGPRPLPVREVKKLSVSWRFRQRVRPGLFSEWTAASNRHKNLSLWKELDKATLQQGGPIYEFQVVIKTLKAVFLYSLSKIFRNIWVF